MSIEVEDQEDLNEIAKRNVSVIFEYLVQNTANATESIVVLTSLVDLICVTVNFDSQDVLDGMKQACYLLKQNRTKNIKSD